MSKNARRTSSVPEGSDRSGGYRAAARSLEEMISAGTGEMAAPRLTERSGYPVSIAVATSLVLIVIVDSTARITCGSP